MDRPPRIYHPTVLLLYSEARFHIHNHTEKKTSITSVCACVRACVRVRLKLCRGLQRKRVPTLLRESENEVISSQRQINGSTVTTLCDTIYAPLSLRYITSCSVSGRWRIRDVRSASVCSPSEKQQNKKMLHVCC